MTLCFQPAFVAFKGSEIAEADYLSHLLAHFRGIHHPEDSDTKNFEAVLAGFNPYAESIRQAALTKTYEPLPNSALQSFYACLTGRSTHFSHHLETLEKVHVALLLQPLATLAAEKGHANILQTCLNTGAKFNDLLDRAVEIGFGMSPDMLTVLANVEWRNIQKVRNDPQAVRDVVWPWLRNKPNQEPDQGKQIAEKRHEQLEQEGLHPAGTCMAGEDLEKKFGDIDW